MWSRAGGPEWRHRGTSLDSYDPNRLKSSEEVEAGRAPPLGGWLPEILFVVVTTGAGIAARGRWLNPISDTGVWWSLIYRLVSGQVLYRDVYLQYGPLSPYLLTLGARIFGLSATYILLSGWVAAILCSLLLLRIARRLLSETERLIVVGLLLPLSVLGPGVNPLVLAYSPAAVHALALSLGALLIISDSVARVEVRSLSAGLLAGLAFCAKQEIGLAALLAVGGYLLVSRAAWSQLVRTLVGFTAMLALGFAFVLWSAPHPSQWRYNHLWPLFLRVPEPWRDLFQTVMGLRGPDWKLLVRGSVWSLGAFLVPIVVAGLLIARERKWRTWLPVGVLAVVVTAWWFGEGYLLTGRFFPACLSVLISLSVAVWSLADRRLSGREGALLFAVGLLAALNGARSAFSTDLNGPFAKISQFLAALTWVLFACRLVPTILAPTPPATKVVRRLLTLVLMLVAWRAAAGSLNNLSAPWAEPFVTRRGTVFLGPDQKRLFSAIRSELKAGETALIVPEGGAVDVLFEVEDRSPWLGHIPGWLDEEAEHVLIRRFEKKAPDAVIVFNRETWIFRRAPFGKGYGQALARWVAQHYVPVQTLPAGSILRLRAASVPPSPI